MNKILLVVSVLALALSAVNTYLLVQISGHMKAVGEKIEPVVRQAEQLQPLLRGLKEKGPPPPPEPLPARDPGEPKILPKPPVELPPPPKL